MSMAAVHLALWRMPWARQVFLLHIRPLPRQRGIGEAPAGLGLHREHARARTGQRGSPISLFMRGLLEDAWQAPLCLSPLSRQRAHMPPPLGQYGLDARYRKRSRWRWRPWVVVGRSGGVRWWVVAGWNAGSTQGDVFVRPRTSGFTAPHPLRPYPTPVPYARTLRPYPTLVPQQTPPL